MLSLTQEGALKKNDINIDQETTGERALNKLLDTSRKHQVNK